MRNWFYLLINAALVAAPPVQAAPPRQIEISYDLSRNGTSLAEIVNRFEHDGAKYRLSEVWKGRGIFALRGSVKRSSEGMVSDSGLKPLEFRDERTGRPTARASFDWQARTITMQYRDPPRTEPLPSHAQDRLAFLYQFVFTPPREPTVTFDLFDGRGQSQHVYQFVGAREKLKTPAGEFDTVKMMRGDDKERAEVWLAVDLSYMPVRVLLVDKDTRIDQVATKILAP